MELDIVFNIDYPSENGIGLLQEEVPKYINYVQVGDFNQFKRLINSINDDVLCYIWVHPSFSAKRVQDGFTSKILIESVPELIKCNISFKEITRSTGKTSSDPKYVNVGTMLDAKKSMTCYKGSDLKNRLKPVLLAEPKQEPRLRLEVSIKGDIKNINQRLKILRQFFLTKITNAGFWYTDLFDLEEAHINGIFGFPYWSFRNNIYQYYLNLENTDAPIIDENILQVPAIIRFNQEKKLWQIDLSFFDEVSLRFEKQSTEYAEKLSIATCLYIIHEAIHKTHNLDCNTVEGIGNFPRIIEEADYQADSIAILSECAFQLYQMGGLKKISPAQLIKILCGIIEIAIETTFSFNPIQEELKLIQVRRVNRYLIWFYHYFKLKNYLIETINSEKLLLKILLQFSSKPLIEITGPAIKSNQGQDRTFYDLNSIKHMEEVAILKINNEIVRMGKTQSINFNELYDGMKQSDFDRMSRFIETLFSNNKHALSSGMN